MRDWLHNLTHKHWAADTGAGKIRTCGWRLWPWTDVYFTPATFGAPTYLLDSRNAGLLEAILASPDAEQAVALIDAAGVR